MRLELFFNELSMQPLAPDVTEGQDRAKQLILVVRDATSKGASNVLHLPDGFLDSFLCPEYTWHNWRKDGRVDIELRRFFQSLTTKSTSLGDSEVFKTFAEMDCYFAGIKAIGLKDAYVSDGLLLSIQSDEKWFRHSLDCEVVEILGEEVSSTNSNVRHASNSSHVELNNDWITERIVGSVSSGNDLWERRGGLFPNLLFCVGVREQCESLATLILPQITRGLFRLNDYAGKWTSGSFEKEKIMCAVSTESAATLAKYKAKHTFISPDHIARVYSLHVKLGKRLRIYFNNDLGAGSPLLIGSIGDHLPTVRFHS